MAARGAMAASGEVSHVEQLRDAVAARVRATSLRGTAREVGMSAPGLQAFLDGSRPHPVTIRKVESWYVRMAAEAGEGLTPTDATAALYLLTRGLPEERQDRARQLIVEGLQALYEDARTPAPEWLQTLKGQIKRKRKK